MTPPQEKLPSKSPALLGLNKHTTILLLPVLSCYVNTCEHIATYTCEHITNEAIVTYDKNQDILTHHNQKGDLWAICTPIHTPPSRVDEIKK